MKLLGQRGDDFAVAVPAQTRLGGDRDADGVHDGSGDFEHTRDIAQQARSGTLSGHLLDRASEVYVYYVGMRLLDNPGGLGHGVGVAAINLYCRRPLAGIDFEFARRGGDIADQSIGADKFRIRHVSTHLLAYQAKGGVGDVLHRCQHQRALAQVYIADFHSRRV